MNLFRLPLTRWFAGSWVYLLPLVLCSEIVAADVNLPDISDASAEGLSVATAHEIGVELYVRLSDKGAIYQDVVATPYLEFLGERLLSASELHHARFFLVNSKSVNAFAAPGGFIGINTGLILAMNDESHVAAVIAHEIAHLQQRHIERSVGFQSRSTLPTLIALFAAALISSQDSQAGQAALYGAVGASQQNLISYTRKNEAEADAVGIQILATAGFDPSGMGAAFETLSDRSRYSGGGVPEFLRTHPYESNRVAEANARAAQFRRPEQKSSASFEFVRGYLEMLNFEERTRTDFTANVSQDGVPDRVLGVCAALLLHRRSAVHSDDCKEAAGNEYDATSMGAYQLVVNSLLAREDSNIERAMEGMRAALDLAPYDPFVNKVYLDLLHEAGEHGEMIALAERLFEADPESVVVVQILEATYARARNKWQATYFRALHLVLEYQPDAAMSLLRRTLLEMGQVDNLARSRMDVLLTRLGVTTYQ